MLCYLKIYIIFNHFFQIFVYTSINGLFGLSHHIDGFIIFFIRKLEKLQQKLIQRYHVWEKYKLLSRIYVRTTQCNKVTN